MTRRTMIGIFVIAGLFFCALSVAVFAEETATAPKSSGLVDDLAGKLSLKPEQAIGAAGAVFALAKTKMSATDFVKLAGGIPEMDTLLKAAPAATAGSNPITSAMGSQAGAAGLLSRFNVLGIPAESALKIVPEVLSFVKAKQGDEITGLLSKAIQ